MATPDRQLTPDEPKMDNLTIEVSIESRHEIKIKVPEKEMDHGSYCGGTDRLYDYISEYMSSEYGISDYDVLDYWCHS